MKTVILKFVIEDEDATALQSQIGHAMVHELNPFPLYFWGDKKSSKTEKDWKKNVYDKGR